MEPNRQQDGFRAALENFELDLAEYKILLYSKIRKDPLVVYFDKPARRFYFSLIAMIVAEMKNLDSPGFIYVRKHEKILKLLDNSLAGQNASKTVKSMWDKIRKAWRYTLPDLEAGALFKIMDRSQISPYEKGGKYRYECSDEECDIWANLFGYDESNPWRFKFAVDSIGLTVNDVVLTFGELKGDSAWQEFVNNLSGKTTTESVEKPLIQRLPKKVKLSWTGIALAVAAAILVLTFFYRSDSPVQVAEVSDNVSIAVLPFVNMSGDPQQEYFSDGISEDLITDLSKIPDLFVIARNSSFTYKVNPVKVQQIAQELGVRYVLEGSVRKVGTQIRINAQLVDAVSGHHLWAERYDREIEDFFVLQDSITKEILTALGVKLTMGEQVRIFSRNTDNIDAYLNFLQAAYHQRKTHQEGNVLARKLCEEAIALDPSFADPYRLLAWTHLWDVWFGWSESAKESFIMAEDLVEQSLALDDTNPNTLALMGRLSQRRGHHEKAIAQGEKSIALDPSNANNYMILAGTLRFAGRAAEGIPLLKKAISLEPHTSANTYYMLGMAYNFTGQYDEAISVLLKGLKRTPDHLLSLIGLTIAYSLDDRMEDARLTAAELLKVNPKLSVANLESKAPYKYKADLELSMGALRKAGLK